MFIRAKAKTNYFEKVSVLFDKKAFNALGLTEKEKEQLRAQIYQQFADQDISTPIRVIRAHKQGQNFQILVCDNRGFSQIQEIKTNLPITYELDLKEISTLDGEWQYHTNQRISDQLKAFNEKAKQQLENNALAATIAAPKPTLSKTTINSTDVLGFNVEAVIKKLEDNTASKTQELKKQKDILQSAFNQERNRLIGDQLNNNAYVLSVDKHLIGLREIMENYINAISARIAKVENDLTTFKKEIAKLNEQYIKQAKPIQHIKNSLIWALYETARLYSADILAITNDPTRKKELIGKFNEQFKGIAKLNVYGHLSSIELTYANLANKSLNELQTFTQGIIEKCNTSFGTSKELDLLQNMLADTAKKTHLDTNTPSMMTASKNLLKSTQFSFTDAMTAEIETLNARVKSFKGFVVGSIKAHQKQLDENTEAGEQSIATFKQIITAFDTDEKLAPEIAANIANQAALEELKNNSAAQTNMANSAEEDAKKDVSFVHTLLKKIGTDPRLYDALPKEIKDTFLSLIQNIKDKIKDEYAHTPNIQSIREYNARLQANDFSVRYEPETTVSTNPKEQISLITQDLETVKQHVGQLQEFQETVSGYKTTAHNLGTLLLRANQTIKSFSSNAEKLTSEKMTAARIINNDLITLREMGYTTPDISALEINISAVDAEIRAAKSKQNDLEAELGSLQIDSDLTKAQTLVEDLTNITAAIAEKQSTLNKTIDTLQKAHTEICPAITSTCSLYVSAINNLDFWEQQVRALGGEKVEGTNIRVPTAIADMIKETKKSQYAGYEQNFEKAFVLLQTLQTIATQRRAVRSHSAGLFNQRRTQTANFYDSLADINLTGIDTNAHKIREFNLSEYMPRPAGQTQNKNKK